MIYAARVPASDAEPHQTAKRAQIQAAVLAATEELLEEGVTFAELNIERIARRAGISRTAFYFYFRDKRELLMRLTEDVTELLYEQAEQWYSGERRPGEEVRGALASVARLYDAHFAAAARDRRGLDLRRGGRRLLARAARALRRRDRSAASSTSSAPGTSPPRCRPRDRVRPGLDDRAHLLPAGRPGRPMAADELVEGLAGVWTRAIYGRSAEGRPGRTASRAPVRAGCGGTRRSRTRPPRTRPSRSRGRRRARPPPGWPRAARGARGSRPGAGT